MIKHLPSLILIFLISLSCDKIEKGAVKQVSSYRFVESSEPVKFELDTLISNDFTQYSMQWSDSGLKFPFFSLLDGNNNRLLVYDNETGKLTRRVYFAKEGPDGIGELLPNDRHFYISNDSIVVFNSMSGTVFLTDNMGKPYKKYKLLDFDKINDIASYPHNFQQLYKIGTNLFFACTISRLNGLNEIKMILRLNLDTSLFDYQVPLPDLYKNSFWGESSMYFSYFTVNPHENKILVSYPLTNQVYVYNSAFSSKREVDMKSQYITQVKPYDDDKNVVTKYTQDYSYFIKVNEESAKKSVYMTVYYDQYSKLYYRVNKLGLSLEKIRKGKTGRDFTISIFDEDFNKVGETTIFDGEKYSIGNLIVTGKGLAIGRKDLNAADENHIYFSLFEAKKVNE